MCSDHNHPIIFYSPNAGEGAAVWHRQMSPAIIHVIRIQTDRVREKMAQKATSSTQTHSQRSTHSVAIDSVHTYIRPLGVDFGI